MRDLQSWHTYTLMQATRARMNISNSKYKPCDFTNDNSNSDLLSRCWQLIERCRELSVNPGSREYHRAYSELESAIAEAQNTIHGGSGLAGKRK
jgi:hypothetical protein